MNDFLRGVWKFVRGPVGRQIAVAVLLVVLEALERIPSDEEPSEPY